MPPPAAAVLVLGAVEVHQHGEGPGGVGPREAYEDGEDDPSMAPPPGGVGVAGADRVAVPCLAVDLAAGVAVDGVVADQDHRPLGGEPAEDEARQGAAQPQARPGGAAEEALVVGAVAGGQSPEGTPEVVDGAPPGGEDGRDQQEGEAPGGRPGERGRQFGP